MSRQKSSAGSSRFGFFIAVVVCIYAAIAIVKYMPLRTQRYEFQEKLQEILKYSGVNHPGNYTVDDMREEIMKKAKELHVPLDPKNLDVSKDENKWRAAASWSVLYKIPGYSTELHYSVDESWTNY